jgi:thioredoxin reductase
VVFSDGAELAIGALLVKAFLDQRSPLAAELSARIRTPDEMLGAAAVEVDGMCRTAVPGLYAAGDAATAVPPSVAAAVASGYLAGASAAVRHAAGY